MNRILLFAILGFLLSTSIMVQGCLFSRFSRRDRFTGKIAKSPYQLTDASKKKLLGKPDEQAAVLQPKTELVLRMKLPTTYQGYCESLSVHLPKTKQNQGMYNVWIGKTQFGPWLSIGQANTTHTFDIDETTFAQAQFVKLRVHKNSADPLYLDAVHVRVHMPNWKPLLQRPFPKVAPIITQRAIKRAHRLYKKGQKQLEDKQYKQALATFKEAWPRMKAHPGIHYALATTYFSLNQFYQSQRLYNMAKKRKAPRDYQLEEMGEVELKLLNYKQAERIFEQCVRQSPFYPRCYYHRIYLASQRGKSFQHMYEMYRDQYLLAKQRADITKRKWRLRKSFEIAYRGRLTSYISRYPQRFRSSEHVAWFGFLLRLYGNDKAGVLEEVEFVLNNLYQREPRARWKAWLFRSAFATHTGFPQKGKQYQQKAPMRTPKQRAEWYALQGDIAKEKNLFQQAKQFYLKGLKKVGKHKAAVGLLQARLHQLKTLHQ